MDIKTIRIIVSVSDNSEMLGDCRQIKSLINELNNRSDGVCIIVETVKAEMAEEYISKLSDCELVFVLFYDTVSNSQRKYFDKAVESYRDNSKPLVVPYIKYIDDIDDVTDEIATLQKHIGEGLHHYYKSYNSGDALKLAVMLQLSEAGYLGLDLSVRNGRINYGGEEEIDTANIPMFANNANLESLKSTLAKLDKTLSGYFEDPTPEKQEKYKSILAKRSDIITRIAEAEKDLFAKMREFVGNTSKGNLDIDQIMAYRFMENGEVELALELLDSTAICQDLKLSEQAIEDAKDRMQRDIDKLCQRIDALDMKIPTLEIVREKGQLFDEIRGYILKYPELDPTPLYRYAIFQKQHNNTELAFRVAEEYYGRVKDTEASDDALLMLLELSVRVGYRKNAKEYGNSILAKENAHPLRVSEACYHLARIYQDEGNYKKSLELYNKSAEIENGFAAKDPYRNDKLSAIYQCMATLYNDMAMNMRDGYSEQYASRAVGCCEMSVGAARRMLEFDDYIGFRSGLAESLQALAVLYTNHGYTEEAIKLFAESEAILQEISGTDPLAYESKLASLYNSAAILYEKIYHREGCEISEYFDLCREYYESAVKIYQKYIVAGEVRFAYELANTYGRIGTLYYNDGKLAQAIENYDRQLSILDSVRGEDIRIIYDLPKLYERNGKIYAILKNEDKSMNCYMKALMYCIKITKEEPAYLREFAVTLSAASDGIITLGNPAPAVSMLNEFIEQYCRIADDGKYHYENRVAYLYIKLGDTAYRNKIYKEAFKYYNTALELYEKACRENDVPGIEKPAQLCEKIGTLLSERIRDYEYSAEFYKKSFVYYRMLTEIDFHKFADAYIWVARLVAITSLEFSDEQALKYYMECVRACKQQMTHNPVRCRWIYTDCHYSIAKLFLPYDKERAKQHIMIAYESCEKMKDYNTGHYDVLSSVITKFLSENFSE